jgi:hypothetical protein
MRNAFKIAQTLLVAALYAFLLTSGVAFSEVARSLGARHVRVPRTDRPNRPLWTTRTTGGIPGFGVGDGYVIAQTYSLANGAEQASTTALDAQTGRLLWKAHATSPVNGSPLFLAVDNGVERVIPRTGVVVWRSNMHCEKSASPSYVAVSGNTVYVGCQGGALFSLSALSGRVVAHSNPAMVDNYDQIIPLGKEMIGVSGPASGGRMYRQSAIVNRTTLSTLVKFLPDVSILGERNGDVFLSDICCLGRNTDSSPAAIERVSLRTGALVSSVRLHPYSRKLPPENDLPGAGPVRLIGDQLYVATSTTLFVYNLSRLDAPRVLYDYLAGRASFIADRYAFIQMRPIATTTRVALVDLSKPTPRIIWSDTSGGWFMSPWQPQLGPSVQLRAAAFGGQKSTILHIANGRVNRIDTACDLATSNYSYILSLCEAPRRYAMYKVGS